jgi:hypothetical protein
VFRYNEPYEDWGAALSLMSLALLAWWIVPAVRRPTSS